MNPAKRWLGRGTNYLFIIPDRFMDLNKETILVKME